jgi:hypothetical protein
MKKTVWTIGILIVGLNAVIAFGQTNGMMQGHRSVMIAQQSKDTNGQKVNQEMKRDVAGIMKQMNETMQKMTQTIDNKMESRNMPAIGKMMREMSVQMNEMAGHMVQGGIDPQTITKMQARMESMNQRLDAI